jgi:transposase InsO family protein
LEAVYCRQALQMALDGLKHPEDVRNLIHHSDRGCQYCSYEYVAMLKERGALVSMTESGDPLENAVAERINGVIKSEWLNVLEIPSRAGACANRSSAQTVEMRGETTGGICASPFDRRRITQRC